jgi:hypothetical protein
MPANTFQLNGGTRNFSVGLTDFNWNSAGSPPTLSFKIGPVTFTFNGSATSDPNVFSLTGTNRFTEGPNAPDPGTYTVGTGTYTVSTNTAQGGISRLSPADGPGIPEAPTSTLGAPTSWEATGSTGEEYPEVEVARGAAAG